ncbi:hypothetical protein VTJ49DRAFT_2325 [Mycothermus thermophilus]|uniref:Uncharacterized protein n=1 Tax=Humicola insolens TaxID=85995 RepID=A0ABR3VQW3_HUMIN
MEANAGQLGNSASGANEADATTKKRQPPVRHPPPPGSRSPYDFHDARTPPFPYRPNQPVDPNPVLQAEHSPRVWNRVPRGPDAAGSNWTCLSISPWRDENQFDDDFSADDFSPFVDFDIVQERLDHATKYFEFFGNTTSRIPWVPAGTMATPQLLFVDGTFAELAQEIADYLQIGDSVRPFLEQENNEEALQLIVKASSALNAAPEKEFTGAYNLLIHLVLQSSDPKKYLPTVCGNLQKPITSSPAHGFTLAANALSSVFNLIDPSNPVRFHVLLQITRFLRQHGQFELLKPRLKNLETWFKDWNTDEEDQRKLYVEISEAAGEAGDAE